MFYIQFYCKTDISDNSFVFFTNDTNDKLLNTCSYETFYIRESGKNAYYTPIGSVIFICDN